MKHVMYKIRYIFIFLYRYLFNASKFIFLMTDNQESIYLSENDIYYLPPPPFGTSYFFSTRDIAQEVKFD
jgi:hypothetical protein